MSADSAGTCVGTDVNSSLTSLASINTGISVAGSFSPITLAGGSFNDSGSELPLLTASAPGTSCSSRLAAAGSSITCSSLLAFAAGVLSGAVILTCSSDTSAGAGAATCVSSPMGLDSTSFATSVICSTSGVVSIVAVSAIDSITVGDCASFASSADSTASCCLDSASFASSSAICFISVHNPVSFASSADCSTLCDSSPAATLSSSSSPSDSVGC